MRFIHTTIPFFLGYTTTNVVTFAFTIPSSPYCRTIYHNSLPHIQTKRSSTTVDEAESIKANTARENVDEKRRARKNALLGLLGGRSRMSEVDVAGSSSASSSSTVSMDPVLACPKTKEPLSINVAGTIFESSTGVRVSLQSSEEEYVGRTDTYFNLLQKEDEMEEDVVEDESEDKKNDGFSLKSALDDARVFLPIPLRNVFPSGNSYIPMRDLFTSPYVSFAYERGWRQGFAAAGFPGPDKEFEMVQDYFAPVNPRTVVDMSCATGLFTRRLTKSNDYERVIACDYSEAMLLEARNRIQKDPELNTNDPSSTKLDLVRCDVGNIPMVSESVDALHAGAAMHCWPDLDSALSEIYRVLKPGGRYFATTFLSSYFRTVQATGGQGVQQQAFQYFENVDLLRDLLLKAGFEDEKVDIEVLGAACVVIKAEK
eukprot:CAMPEP_0184858782 /NCGR_PEP_ID=MMETSP0580-20130426/3833_1 /TAXON_ID=1118495 /ORGANISM="Dactyliosolen fragilissimus" /LENGTH=428 /DNA_ID=CAMNT_0027355089 /DNA_START=21 /DNA_END=1307 /DNA_ORIENTATION=-